MLAGTDEAHAAQSTARPGPQLATETVAVLGAGGPLGFPIARNLARAGLRVRAWPGSPGKPGKPGKAVQLAPDGAYLAATPRDAAAGADVVITMLADEAAVIAAMAGPDGALAALSGVSALWAQMSTIGEAATRRCTELVRASGVGFVDAPVLGTRQLAEEGRLVVLASGPEAARRRLAPIFALIGQHTIHAGEAGAGSRLKLVANSWVMAVVEAAAETIGPGQPDPAPAYDPGLPRLALAARDASLVRGAAEEHGLNLPLLAAIARRYAES